jgi:hypothetical protein
MFEEPSNGEKSLSYVKANGSGVGEGFGFYSRVIKRRWLLQRIFRCFKVRSWWFSHM